jgi:hypothetical protein
VEGRLELGDAEVASGYRRGTRFPAGLIELEGQVDAPDHDEGDK